MLEYLTHMYAVVQSGFTTFLVFYIADLFISRRQRRRKTRCSVLFAYSTNGVAE